MRDVVAVRPGVGARRAAVLVLISSGADGPEILFVERAATMRTHAGQIALPGGAADREDRTLVDTALREAYEEVGVEPGSVVVLGTLPAAHVAVSGFDVTAVVGWWQVPGPVTALDLAEVAQVHVVKVSDLVDPARRVTVRHPLGYTGPAFQLAGLLIWGLTAHLIDGVLELAGWQRPWDRSRMATIPERYLMDRRASADLGGPDAH
ncbi:MAG TPA: CoA pyrophosphatase [Propionibacteriaceae bacterium]|nr:CoA pyrophosphatase [Propionibacteriaceae bacterium]